MTSLKNVFKSHVTCSDKFRETKKCFFQLTSESHFAHRYGSRRRKLDRQKMKELLEVWQRASPITYNRSR